MLTRKRILAAKIESTSGTAETLANGDAGMVVHDLTIQPEAEFEPRQKQGSMGQHAGNVGARAGRATFKTELTGDGAGGVPTWASTLLPGCGWVNSAGTFSPRSEAPGSNVKTLTMGAYLDGMLKRISGAAGTCKPVFVSGKKIMLEWDFMGVWIAPNDTALLTPTYPTEKPLRFAGATWTIGSWTPKVESMSIDFGNNVVMREDATNESGYCAAIVSDRRIMGNMNPESSLVATEDTYGKWLSGEERAFSLAVADVNDTITFAGPKCQIVNPQESERNMIQTDDIEFQFNSSASAGDDEFTIDFAAT